MVRTTPVTWSSYLLLPHIPQAGELSIFYSAIVGAVLGFLWYNCHPAQTFMGDVGSLPLGAAMGYGALVTRNEILLLIIGGVFILELFSVVLQVSYFKYTGGKRLFRCAPIHHHFHLIGWSEPQVVVRFWLLAAAFAAIALATLKIR
jgi:phospho-N-acetylmuramoyl-pentapeptide-transferase